MGGGRVGGGWVFGGHLFGCEGEEFGGCEVVEGIRGGGCCCEDARWGGDVIGVE